MSSVSCTPQDGSDAVFCPHLCAIEKNHACYFVSKLLPVDALKLSHVHTHQTY